MSYDPDLQDEIVGDALALGGTAFVDELHWTAAAAAAVVCGWEEEGDGPEPPGYRQAWIAAARELVAERRAMMGRARHAAGHDDPAGDPGYRGGAGGSGGPPGDEPGGMLAVEPVEVEPVIEPAAGRQGRSERDLPDAGEATDRGGGRVLSEAEIAALQPGDRVEVHRHLPAASDRPAHTQRWLVEVAEIHHWPRDDGWSLVPAKPVEGLEHPLDIHVGVTGHGMRTELHWPDHDTEH